MAKSQFFQDMTWRLTNKTESLYISQKFKARLKGLYSIEFECLLYLAYFHWLLVNNIIYFSL